MSVEFGGMGSMVVTMKAVAVTTGGIAGMDGNDTVRNANGGVAPVGVVLNKRNNHAAVQIRGYVRVKYSGSPAPVLGWNRLVTDGAGGPLNLLAQGGGLGIHGVLIAPADLKEHGPQGIAVLRQLRGQLGGDVRQLGPFPGRVQGGQSLLLLGLAHPGHHVHPLGKGVDQGVVNGINFCSQFL